MKLEIMHYVNVARHIKSAFRRGRLTDIPRSSSFYHSTGWNPLASSRIEATHQSATRQCEILKTIDKTQGCGGGGAREDRSDVSLYGNGSRAISCVKLVATLASSPFQQNVLLHHINIYLYRELSFLMQITQ